MDFRGRDRERRGRGGRERRGEESKGGEKGKEGGGTGPPPIKKLVTALTWIRIKEF